MKITSHKTWQTSLIFGTSPNIKLEEKKGGDVAHYLPPNRKSGGTRPPYPPPNCARDWIHCIENIFTVQDFWATCACPEKQFPLKFFTVLNIFLTTQNFWATLCLPWKTAFALKIFTVLKTFYIQDFWATCVCPEFTVLIFLSFRILNNLRLSWKTELSWTFSVLKYSLSFRIFEKLALALKNRECPEFTVLDIYFLLFRLLNNLRLPWNFSPYWKYFFFQDFWTTYACPENRVCPDFFKGGKQQFCRPIHSYFRPWPQVPRGCYLWLNQCSSYTYTLISSATSLVFYLDFNRC